MLLPGSRLQTHRSRLIRGLLYGAGLATAAVLLHSLHDIHRMFIYNKMATPPIALLVAACTTWAWALVYGLVDMRGWRR